MATKVAGYVQSTVAYVVPSKIRHTADTQTLTGMATIAVRDLLVGVGAAVGLVMAHRKGLVSVPAQVTNFAARFQGNQAVALRLAGMVAVVVAAYLVATNIAHAVASAISWARTPADKKELAPAAGSAAGAPPTPAKPAPTAAAPASAGQAAAAGASANAADADAADGDEGGPDAVSDKKEREPAAPASAGDAPKSHALQGAEEALKKANAALVNAERESAAPLPTFDAVKAGLNSAADAAKIADGQKNLNEAIAKARADALTAARNGVQKAGEAVEGIKKKEAAATNPNVSRIGTPAAAQ